MNFESVVRNQKEFYLTYKYKNVDFRKAQLTKLKYVLESGSDLHNQSFYNNFVKSRFDTFKKEFSFVQKDIE